MLDVKSRVKAVPTDASEYLAPAGEVKDEQFDWWSKFYASLQDPKLKEKEYDELKLDKLVVRLNTVSVCCYCTASHYMQQVARKH